MATFTLSSGPNPCPMCDRTKDGDCRILDSGMVLCHSVLNGVPKGKPHSDRPFIYCGQTDEGPGAGIWKPVELCEDRTDKAPRKAGPPVYFDYFFWDGTPTPARRYRKDVPGKPKDIGWCKGGLRGRPQVEVAPYRWHIERPLLGIGDTLFIVRGELKADLLASRGFHAISLLNQNDERLIIELRTLVADGADIVLAPDNDIKDLDHWYATIAATIPQAKSLLCPLKGMDWRIPPEDGGLGIEDWITRSQPSNDDILAAITSSTWHPTADAPVGEVALTTANTQPAESLDDLLGPVENGKLRRPRTDHLTQVMARALPLRFNLLTQRIENDGQPIDGDFLGTLYLQLAERFQIEVAKDRACDAAILQARRNAFHPVRDYLRAITTQLPPEQWESIAQHIFNTADPVAGIHLRRQLIGLVARAMNPGCKLDTALVIHSPQQGIGKSTMWAILGGPWFSDSLGDLRNIKEEMLAVHSAWIHEWGEIDAVVGKRESEAVKKFLSSTSDNVRRPYGRGYETLVRSCGIVGTTNRSDFIKDPTGNRRFPVIAVNQVNTDWVHANRDAIWGSALAAFNNGTPWHYDNTENAAISKAAQDFAAEDPLRDQIETWMDDHPDITAIAMPVIVFHLSRDRQRDQEFSRQVSLRLTALGWSKSQRRERGFLPDGTRHDKATIWELPPTAPAL
jgi:predicted P-loop ATPase